MSEENVELVLKGTEAWNREGDMRFSQVATFRGGKVVLNEFFWDHQEALEAAGLSA